MMFLATLASLAVLAAPSPTEVRVAVFLSARCPCSASHEPVLKRLQEKFRPQGVVFEGYHSNQDETAEEGAEHFAKARLGFEVRRDPGAKRANELLALKTPHAYVFVGARLVYRGGIDNSQVAQNATEPYLERAIEAALKALKEGAEPAQIPLQETRVLGCVIQRST